eukprot:403377460
MSKVVQTQEVLKRWQDSQQNSESNLLEQQKCFRKYRFNIYILNHNALKIQHWFFNRQSQIQEEKKKIVLAQTQQEIIDKTTQQLAQRIDVYKTKKRSVTQSHTGLGVINLREQQFKQLVQVQNTQDSLVNQSQTTDQINLVDQSNLDLLPNQVGIFDDKMAFDSNLSSKVTTLKNEPQAEYQINIQRQSNQTMSPQNPISKYKNKSPDQTSRNSLFNQNQSLGKNNQKQQYSNIESRLFTPTKSALGKYGSRYEVTQSDINSQNKITKEVGSANIKNVVPRTANISPFVKNAGIQNNRPSIMMSPVLNLKKRQQINVQVKGSVKQETQQTSIKKLNINRENVQQKTPKTPIRQSIQQPSSAIKTSIQISSQSNSKFNSRAITPIKILANIDKSTSQVKMLERKSVLAKYNELSKEKNSYGMKSAINSKAIMDYSRQKVSVNYKGTNLLKDSAGQISNRNSTKVQVKVNEREKTPIKQTSYQTKLQQTYQNKSPQKKIQVINQTQIKEDTKIELNISQNDSPQTNQYQNKYFKPNTPTIVQSRKISATRNDQDVLDLSPIKNSIDLMLEKQKIELQFQELLHQRDTLLQGKLSANNQIQQSPAKKSGKLLSIDNARNSSQQRPKSEILTNRSGRGGRPAPLIEILKLTDQSSQESTSVEKQSNDKKIVYQFKNIVY